MLTFIWVMEPTKLRYRAQNLASSFQAIGNFLVRKVDDTYIPVRVRMRIVSK